MTPWFLHGPSFGALRAAAIDRAATLASAATVRITRPAATIDDEPLLESPVLDELRRVTGIEPQREDFGDGYREDVHTGYLLHI